jgi:hypothetical protein
MNEKKDFNESTNDRVISDIRNAVTDLDFGTVTIKVHNSKIVQLEITRKKRFDYAGSFEKGGGI